MQAFYHGLRPSQVHLTGILRIHDECPGVLIAILMAIMLAMMEEL